MNETFTPPDPAAAAKVEAFLADLGAVCHKHGIGLGGDPIMFVMDDMDANRRFYASPDSWLSFV